MKELNLEEAIKILKQKFTSGNDVPVTRATILREEFEPILKAFENEQNKPLETKE